MKKIFLLLFISRMVLGQSAYIGELDSTKIPRNTQHYQEEYSDEINVDTLRWMQEKAGLHVSFAATDKLYLRSEVPQIKAGESFSWEETGWKGERLNTFVLVWSPDTLQQVRFELNDLVNEKGKKISRDNIKVNLVKYVISNYPYAVGDVTCGESPYKNAYLMPDRLAPLEGSDDRFELLGRTVRPVWLTVNIPRNAEHGNYSGTITVNSEKQKINLNVKLKVQNQVLPEPRDWKFRLDLWQNPWVVAWYYDLKPWSDEHMVMLRDHMKMYADAGGTFITTYAVHSPWSDNSYMIEGAMIEWIKKSNDTWKFDYTIFDKYIKLAMEMGIDEAITIYTPIPWGNRFRYMDEKTGNYVYEAWAPEAPEFVKFWNIFLDDLQKHLKNKGWFNKTYLGINENEMKQTLAAIKVIKDHSKDWKITYAGDWHPELDLLLDDYSSVYSKEPTLKEVKARTSRGATSTFYVCCTPPKPNNFVFSPPSEGRWISWYTAAYGYEGFLRWAYDAWPQDPVRDARHTFWAAGDCFLVYPGGNSSIRFEKLREGIVDFEKIKILKEAAAKSTSKNAKDLAVELDTHLQTLVGEKEFDEEKIKQSVNKGKQILQALTDALTEINIGAK